MKLVRESHQSPHAGAHRGALRQCSNLQLRNQQIASQPPQARQTSTLRHQDQAPPTRFSIPERVVVEAYRTYRATYDIARHYEKDVLPLRKTISDEMMLRYGAMQVDVFALLVEARQKIAVNSAAADAARDFWLASADLSTVITGGGTVGAETASVTMPPSGGGNRH